MLQKLESSVAVNRDTIQTTHEVIRRLYDVFEAPMPGLVSKSSEKAPPPPNKLAFINDMVQDNNRMLADANGLLRQLLDILGGTDGPTPDYIPTGQIDRPGRIG